MRLWILVGLALVVALPVLIGFGVLGVGRQPSTTTVTAPKDAAAKPADKPERSDSRSRAGEAAQEPAADPGKAPAKVEETGKDSAKEAAKNTEPSKPVQAAGPAPKQKVLPRIVEVGGENCIPCKLMAPVLEELRSEYKGKLTVTTVDQTKDPEIARKYRVTTIPTQILYDTEGREIARHFGFFARDEIVETFAKHGIKL